MSNQIYIDSNNRKINISKAWANSKTMWPHDVTSFEDWGRFLSRSKNTNLYPRTPGFLLNKIMSSSYIRNLLDEYGLMRDFDGMLDICTGPAILPRLFKFHGIVNQAVGIDIMDRSDEYDDEYVYDILSKVNYDGKVSVKPDDAKAIAGTIEELVSVQNDLNFATEFLSFKDPGIDRLSLEKYMAGDFMTMDESCQYDLITLNAGMEYFDTEKFFAKVYRLLNKGGVFITFNDYFYDVWGASMHMTMDGPWLHTRLSKEDFFDYAQKHRSEWIETYKSSYYFPSTHKTVYDLIDEAKDAGLISKGFRRKIQKPLLNAVLGTDVVSYLHQTVLPDARYLNPRVEVADFYTNYLTLVMVKEE
jgi:SAM-dependent methyltransferase